MKILVIGGSGYIGKHICYELFKNNIEFISVDLVKPEPVLLDLIYSKPEFDYIIEDFSKIEDIPLNFDFIINCAAFSNAREFEKNQFSYNTELNESASLFANKKKAHLIFLSSSATYSPSKNVHSFNDEIIEELLDVKGLNQYGRSKIYSEYMMYTNKDTSFTSLRLFNVVGNSMEVNIGEEHNPETHILPNIYSAIHNNSYFKINGNKFETYDGTCVRSYIDVRDICSCIISVIEKNKNRTSIIKEFYNVCNNDNNYSVIDIYNKFLNQYNKFYKTNKKSKYYFSFNSKDDYPIIKGCNIKTIKELNWKPKFDIYDSIFSLITYRNKKELKE